VGLRRQWFGPSKEEVWRELAGQIGASYVEGGFWRGDKVEARVKEWTITLDTYTVSTGKVTIVYTRLRAPFVNPDGFLFQVYRAGVFSEFGKWLGAQDVIVGHQPFDTDFIVKASGEQTVRALLSNARIRERLEAQPNVHFGVEQGGGWLGPDLPEGVSELRFHCGGVIKDVALLRGLYELFAETLDELCRLGSAYADDPGVSYD